MSKLFRKIAIIMLLTPSTIGLTSCDNQEEVSNEKLDYGFILETIKNHLETGIDARTLSFSDPKIMAFNFISDYIKQHQSLINVQLIDDQPNANLVVDENGQVIIKIEISLGLQNFLIDAKLLNVKTPLTALIEDVTQKHFKNGIIIDGSSLDNQDQFSSALQLIKKDPFLGSSEYNFILEINEKDRERLLDEGDNKIAVIFKLLNKKYIEIVEIIIKDVKVSPINAAFRNLSIINNDIGLTMRHKTEYFQDFISQKIKAFNKDLKIKSVVKKDDSNVTSIDLNVELEDVHNRTKTQKIQINNLSLFKINELRDEIAKIISDNNLVFEIPVNDDVDETYAAIKTSDFDFQMADNKNLTNLTTSLKNNAIIKEKTTYDCEWKLALISSSFFDAKTVTEADETREITVRLKVKGSSAVSNKITIKYQVK